MVLRFGREVPTLISPFTAFTGFVVVVITFSLIDPPNPGA